MVRSTLHFDETRKLDLFALYCNGRNDIRWGNRQSQLCGDRIGAEKCANQILYATPLITKTKNDTLPRHWYK